MANPNDLDDYAFIELCEKVFAREPLLQLKPGTIARLYRIADMEFTARQFETMIERVSLPNLPEVCRLARATLAGIDPRHYEAVMLERSMICDYLKSADMYGEHPSEWHNAIWRGDHRAIVVRPEIISEGGNRARS